MCSGHGECETNQTEGTATCLCSAGWYGTHCEQRSLLPDNPVVYYLIAGVVGTIVLSTIVLAIVIFVRRKPTDLFYSPVVPIDDTEDPFASGDEEVYY